nr:MAG TPA: adenine-specific methyltransferase [Caudoviricetes sp.]
MERKNLQGKRNGRHALHPAQRNINLFETLLLDDSAEHQTVSDPCMGSGATGVAALRNKRNFIGVELIKNYFENCVKRLDKLKQV